jgi:hypothetical protein
MSQYPPQQYPPQGYGNPPPPGYGAPPPGGYGGPPQQGYPGGVPQPQRSNGAAIASLICSLLGCIPFITSLLAILLGIIGIRNTKDPRVGGKGMAIAGLILGLLGLAVWGLMGGTIWALIQGTAPMRDSAKAFVTDLANGNVAQAQTHATSRMTKPKLDAVSASLQSMGKLQDVTCVGFKIDKSGNTGTVGQVGAHLAFSGGSQQSILLQMTKQGDQWLVDEIETDPNKVKAAGGGQ